MSLELKAQPACRPDLVSLGEVMLRLDPGEGRIHATRGLTVWEGGGECNVARGLRRCFGRHTGVLTALAESPIVARVRGTTYEPGPLVPGATYRWRVDAVTPGGIVEGTEWSFTCGPAATGTEGSTSETEE